MDRLTALAYLGVDETATKDDIDTAWRGAVKRAHPDTGSDSDASQVMRLNEARAIALDGLSDSGGELITQPAIREMVRLQQEMTATASASDRAMKQVVMHHVGSLALQRRQRATFAIISGVVAAVLALIGAVARATPEEFAWHNLLFTLAGVLGVGAALLGLLSWRMKFREQRLEMEIEDAAETLADRGALAATLTEIGLGDFFTLPDLQRALADWGSEEKGFPPRPASPLSFLAPPTYRSVPLSQVAALIGPVDFGKLLIAKGKESGLLEESERRSDGESKAYGYRRT